jgi:hypothetical protein
MSSFKAHCVEECCSKLYVFFMYKSIEGFKRSVWSYNCRLAHCPDRVGWLIANNNFLSVGSLQICLSQPTVVRPNIAKKKCNEPADAGLAKVANQYHAASCGKAGRSPTSSKYSPRLAAPQPVRWTEATVVTRIFKNTFFFRSRAARSPTSSSYSPRHTFLTGLSVT